MKIDSVTISNFRCFSGDEPFTLRFSDEVTALIGANGSGKSAFLTALTRVFGVNQSERGVIPSDFFFAPVHPVSTEKHLFIDVRLAFPELDDESDPSAAVPPAFNHMIVDEPGATPYCRVRLEAIWTDDGTTEGAIEQKTFWVRTGEADVPDDMKIVMLPRDRAMIQVRYIPATRDPNREIRVAATSRLGRLLRATSWTDATKEAAVDGAETIRTALDAEPSLGVINESIQRRWGELYDAHFASKAELRLATGGIDNLIEEFNVRFSPSEGGSDMDPGHLSEGQLSLFYLSLVAALFDVEGALAQEADDGAVQRDWKFQSDRLNIPHLTVFALEEPENHLAPYLLARVIGLARSLSASKRAQTVFSSHSSSALTRVEPREIRYFRIEPTQRTATAREIHLPELTNEVHKYVREAVRAYPELYFARFVILAEGPSEQVVIPKLLEAFGLEADSASVAVVPLGGRHVNHFWKLLADLGLPYCTLLDLDLGRTQGGWSRIKYALQQLSSIGVHTEDLLSCETDEGSHYSLTPEQLLSLHTHPIEDEDMAELRAWIDHLERFGVFFSYPLAGC